MFIKKFISTLTILVLLLGQFAPVASAQLLPPPPPPPPTAPTAPPPPPDSTTPPPAPTAPPPPGVVTPTPTVVQVEPTPAVTAVPEPTPVAVSTETAEPTIQGTSNDGRVEEDAVIQTGDATNTGTLITNANSNLSLGTSVAPTSGGSAQIVNTGNGDETTNTGSATIVNNDTTVQNNSAVVVNDLTQTATTGSNSASSNVRSDSTIETGDANVSGTIINTVNTNAAGVMVSEFNIVDDHVGDYVLDFGANCIAGCSWEDTYVANTENGSDSDNLAALTTVDNSLNFQTNVADIENNLILVADSGHNIADANTQGDSNIVTGDANVSANVLTFANNNIEGNVIYGVVNIYGDLVGDIIFPEEYFNSCCAGSSTVANTNNGSSSTNTANLTDVTNSTTYQTNVADIDNVLLLDAQTGENSTSRNTNGDSNISTGDVDINANVINVANSNVVGNWWLVLVNEAGEWVGRIMGAPDGSNFLGSPGTEIRFNEEGEIVVTNGDNGSGSTNTGSVTNISNETTVQTNTANIANNLQLTANTGGNSASRNTGGNSSIETGDANIVANLVNFVNNNFASGGKLVVTVVNVFGSWLGNFVGPGQQQAENHTENVGGAEVQTSNNTPSANTTNTSSSLAPAPTSVSAQPVAVVSAGSTPPAVVQTTGKIALASETPTPLVQVAGFTTQDLGDPAEVFAPSEKTKKTIHINLAWLLILVPAGAILLITKRKLLHRTLPS